MSYETITTGLTVLPKGEAVYHEAATEITLDHEVGNAGHEAIVTLRQTDEDAKVGEIRLAADEWPQIRAAVEKLLGIA